MRDEVSKKVLFVETVKDEGVKKDLLYLTSLEIYNLYQSLPCFCVDVKPTNLVWKRIKGVVWVL